MNLTEFYEPGEKSSLADKERRELIHCAYWVGVGLSKHFGSVKTSPADNRALELAFLEGFLSNKEESYTVHKMGKRRDVLFVPQEAST